MLTQQKKYSFLLLSLLLIFEITIKDVLRAKETDLLNFSQNSTLSPQEQASLQKIQSELANLLEKNKIYESLQVLSTAIETFPSVHELILQRGLILMKGGHLLSAWDDFQLAYDFGVRNRKLLYSMALLEKSKNRFIQALEYFNEAVEYKDSDIDQGKLFFDKAVIELQLQKLHLALTSIDSAITASNNVIKYHELYIEILVKLQSFDEAIEELKSLIQQFPNHIWFTAKLANIYMQEQELDEAEELLLSILLKKDNSIYRFQLAAFYVSQKRFNAALIQYRYGLKLDPNSIIGNIQIANILWHLRQPENAFVFFKKAKDLGSKERFIFQRIAHHYNDLDQTYRAEETILEGLLYHPNDLYLLTEYSKILEKRGKYEEVFLAYQQMIEIDESNYFFHGKIAVIYQIKQNYPLAEKHFLRSLELRSDAYWVRAYYAEFLIEQKKWQLALNQLNMIALSSSKQPWVFHKKTIVEKQLGRLKLSLESVDKAIELAPDRIVLQEIKAEILRELGELKVAENTLRTALVKRPNHYRVMRKLAFVLFAQNNTEEAFLFIKQVLENSEPELSAIELFHYLSNQINSIWGFKKESAKGKILKQILQGNFKKAENLISKKTSDSQILTLIYLKEYLQQQSPQLLNLKKSNGWSLFYQGYNSLINQELEKASDFLLKALQAKPNIKWIQLELAYAYEQNKELEQAIFYYENNLQQLPNNSWIKSRLAMSYYLNKEALKAENMYLQILKDEPNDELALNNLAWLYLTTEKKELQKVKEALLLSKKAVSIRASSENLDTLAEAYYQTKQYKQALLTIEKALDRDRADSDYFKKQKKKIKKALLSIQ